MRLVQSFNPSRVLQEGLSPSPLCPRQPPESGNRWLYPRGLPSSRFPAASPRFTTPRTHRWAAEGSRPPRSLESAQPAAPCAPRRRRAAHPAPVQPRGPACSRCYSREMPPPIPGPDCGDSSGLRVLLVGQETLEICKCVHLASSRTFHFGKPAKENTAGTLQTKTHPLTPRFPFPLVETLPRTDAPRPGCLSIPREVPVALLFCQGINSREADRVSVALLSAVCPVQQLLRALPSEQHKTLL
ncbi:unnamed protein product [Rangifer tarandus platyrhynchus]|uniref:Uncharacterized protein n=2 Tax=Rangifer tarandus platyrhynchus TaxID=3082113 RepID=A0ACB0EHX0_RANTA|nr:unnamed protein product [Rangifer tarandus platyrhynchus]CAI9699854.1 unnamed protein product [Rangifer tarandus platyrhynchus]